MASKASVIEAEQPDAIEQEQDVLDSIFGVKPKGSIFLPSQPLSVRLDCKDGQLTLGEDSPLGKTAEISVLKVTRWFGDMGMTKGAEWLQIFYVGAPQCDTLPKDTVCVSFLKTRSLGQFQRVITTLLAAGTNPAKGIFGVSFADHVSGQNRYKSVKFEYRERTEGEMEQLQAIGDFMAGNPRLVDVRPGLQCIDGMSAEEIEFLVNGNAPGSAALPAGK
jgi:hypothetical protein